MGFSHSSARCSLGPQPEWGRLLWKEGDPDPGWEQPPSPTCSCGAPAVLQLPAVPSTGHTEGLPALLPSLQGCGRIIYQINYSLMLAHLHWLLISSS